MFVYLYILLDILVLVHLESRSSPFVPVSITSCDFHGLSREETVLDKHVDILTEVR